MIFTQAGYDARSAASLAEDAQLVRAASKAVKPETDRRKEQNERRSPGADACDPEEDFSRCPGSFTDFRAYQSQ